MWTKALSRKTMLTAVSALALGLSAGSALAHKDGTVIYEFSGYPSDGSNPANNAPAFDKAGNMFGTTNLGGANGGGAVYRIDATSDIEHVLYSFTNDLNGYEPEGTLWVDANGNAFGTAQKIVYELVNTNGDYAEKTLYQDSNASFKGGVVMDKKGNLYGTDSVNGDYGQGYVFEVDTNGKFSKLHSFSGNDGISPEGDLTIDKRGNIYGMTYEGGGLDEEFCGGASGGGVIYKITHKGKFSVLAALTTESGCSPQVNGLLLDKDGNLFGVGTRGGTIDGQPSNYGTIFELTSAGELKALYNFTSGKEGSNPQGKLVEDHQGNLYGTTMNGGKVGQYPAGEVFRFVPETGKLTVLSHGDGFGVKGGVTVGPYNRIYGTTYDGGDQNCDCGTVFLVPR
jgi:uncharacterized repeat protein (TIGR03803 family)